MSIERTPDAYATGDSPACDHWTCDQVIVTYVATETGRKERRRDCNADAEFVIDGGPEHGCRDCVARILFECRRYNLAEYPALIESLRHQVEPAIWAEVMQAVEGMAEEDGSRCDECERWGVETARTNAVGESFCVECEAKPKKVAA